MTDKYFSSCVYDPIDLCALYEPFFEPPPEQVEEWRRQQETEPSNPFSCTATRQIGNTWYIIETACDGDEPLPNIVRRLIFSNQEPV